MTLAERFGADLRRRRRHLGWSQETLGRMAGLHRSEIQKLEAGRREPGLRTIVRLADALGVDPGGLVAGLRP